MDIFHEPIEDTDVTVDGDVDIVKSLLIGQVLLEVFHVVQKQSLVAFEILGGLLVFIADVDDHHVDGVDELGVAPFASVVQRGLLRLGINTKSL